MKDNIHTDHHTDNESFLKFAGILKERGVLNSDFCLKVINNGLIGKHPLEEGGLPAGVTPEEIVEECRNNIWYYLREIVRVYDAESPSGVRFILSDISAEIVFCFERGLNIWATGQRQSGVSTTVAAILSWVLVFNEGVADILAPSFSSTTYMSYAYDILNLLPGYLRRGKTYNTHLSLAYTGGLGRPAMAGSILRHTCVEYMENYDKVLTAARGLTAKLLCVEDAGQQGRLEDVMENLPPPPLLIGR